MDIGHVRLIACRRGNFKLGQGCKGSWRHDKGVLVVSSGQ